MFVTISRFQARPGEEDAVVALHEEWARSQLPRVDGFVSGELLAERGVRSSFVRILRYLSQEAAQRLERDPEQAAWERRLTSLTTGEVEGKPFEITWLSEAPVEDGIFDREAGFASPGGMD